MPKLAVNITQDILTGPLSVKNYETFEIELLTGKKLQKYMEGVDLCDIGFEIISTNEEHEISFNFNKKDGKKGASIDLRVKDDLSGLEVGINGTFEVKLRAGVAPTLQEMGESLDLRLCCVTYKGGYRTGFSAYRQGSDANTAIQAYQTISPKIDEFKIK